MRVRVVGTLLLLLRLLLRLLLHLHLHLHLGEALVHEAVVVHLLVRGAVRAVVPLGSCLER